MHKILKSFPYSHDGLRVVSLQRGQNVEIRADLTAGLEAEGFIGPAGEAPPAFDPSTAGADALRAFLQQHGVKPHHKTGEDKLREMVAAKLAKE